MKKLVACLLLCVVTSCKIQQVVIVDKWEPVDYQMLKERFGPKAVMYPISDTDACAIEIRDLNSGQTRFTRDKNCFAFTNYQIGDTIEVILKKPQNK